MSAEEVKAATDGVEKLNTSEANAGEANAAPSKNALKKAQKEKEKAEKAAKRAAAEEAARKEREAAEANDVSKEDYGDLGPDGALPATLADVPIVSLDALSEEDAEKEARFTAVVKNARSQSAKLAFLVFQHKHSTIQAVVAASEKLSKQVCLIASCHN
jgi:aspartyl-tRNA synthetase